MKTSLLLAIAFACTAMTCRVVEHPSGVRYSHRSFGVVQSFGELTIDYNTNSARVTLKNFANDQVSAIREAKEFVQEVNKLKP
jgi:hypothetical protein